MDEYKMITDSLKRGRKGFTVTNDDNGRMAEVAEMAGGRYLLWEMDPDTGLNQVTGQTNSARKAYQFVLG